MRGFVTSSLVDEGRLHPELSQDDVEEDSYSHVNPQDKEGSHVAHHLNIVSMQFADIIIVIEVHLAVVLANVHTKAIVFILDVHSRFCLMFFFKHYFINIS